MIDYLLDRMRLLGIATGLQESEERRSWLRRALFAAGQRALESSIAEEVELASPSDPAANDPKRRKAFIPRDAPLSLLQALHEQHMEQQRQQELVTRPATFSSRSYATSTSLWEQIDDPSAENVSWGHGFDYRWATKYFWSLIRYGRKRRNFSLPAGAPQTQSLADDARVVLVSDWGTGEHLADQVAEQIRAVLHDAGGRETHVVHLGDVYYAGTPYEAQTRFLDHWPVHLDEADRHHSWCLNGNHDMYAAGEGLFRVILDDPRFAKQRTTGEHPTSEVHLSNRNLASTGA